jgi:imipenem/basic amino acid-specific outer membrane pore
MPTAPIFYISTVRLIPSTATGWTLQSKEIEGLELDYGRFTSTNAVNGSNSDEELTTDYGVGIIGKRVDYLGATYDVNKQLRVSFYGSEFKDVWRQYYGYAKYVLPISEKQALSFTLNAYRTKDTGDKRGGPIDNNMISVAANYNIGAHGFMLGYQQVNGNEPNDWIGFGNFGGNVMFTNAMQYSTFAEANEHSWKFGYDLNMAAFGVPGLRFLASYARGDDMDNSHSKNTFYTARHVYDPDKDNKHWERNVEVSYVVQSGVAEGLSIRVRQASHRGTTGIRHQDIDEIRVITEYPLNLF